MVHPRIAVLGSGANGTSVAADLTTAGYDVTVIEQWPEHVRAIRSNGATIVLPDRTVNVALDIHDLCRVATFRAKFDVVLMLMKAYDSRWAAELIRPHLADDGLVVGVQNGMTIDAIAAAVGAERTMGCVIEITSAMFEPGVVERHSPKGRSWFAVGAISESTRGREEEIAELLRNVGAVDVVDDIRSTKFMKLVSNATTLVTTAIVGLSMVEAAQIPEMRDIMLRSGREALDAGRAAGYEVLPIFGLKAADVQGDDPVEMLLDTLLEGFVLPNSKTTVLQDWMKERHSEVDDLNGWVVRTAAENGVPAPVNTAVVEIAQRIEDGSLKPSLANLALLRERAAALAAQS